MKYCKSIICIIFAILILFIFSMSSFADDSQVPPETASVTDAYRFSANPLVLWRLNHNNELMFYDFPSFFLFDDPDYKYPNHVNTINTNNGYALSSIAYKQSYNPNTKRATLEFFTGVCNTVRIQLSDYLVMDDTDTFDMFDLRIPCNDTSKITISYRYSYYCQDTDTTEWKIQTNDYSYSFTFTHDFGEMDTIHIADLIDEDIRQRWAKTPDTGPGTNKPIGTYVITGAAIDIKDYPKIGYQGNIYLSGDVSRIDNVYTPTQSYYKYYDVKWATLPPEPPPPGEGDYISWLIDPIVSFFNLEIFPGFSLGLVLSLTISVLIVAYILKLVA